MVWSATTTDYLCDSLCVAPLLQIVGAATDARAAHQGCAGDCKEQIDCGCFFLDRLPARPAYPTANLTAPTRSVMFHLRLVASVEPALYRPSNVLVIPLRTGERAPSRHYLSRLLYEDRKTTSPFFPALCSSVRPPSAPLSPHPGPGPSPRTRIPVYLPALGHLTPHADAPFLLKYLCLVPFILFLFLFLSVHHEALSGIVLSLSPRRKTPRHLRRPRAMSRTFVRAPRARGFTLVYYAACPGPHCGGRRYRI